MAITAVKSQKGSALIPKTRIVWCLHSVASFIESCDRGLQSFCGVTPVKLVHAFEVQVKVTIDTRAPMLTSDALVRQVTYVIG